jgi:hypothetical protein
MCSLRGSSTGSNNPYQCIRNELTTVKKKSFKILGKTSTILEQEFRSGVGKFGLGNTSFHSTVQLLAASLVSVEVTLTWMQNLGQTDKQTDGRTDIVFLELLRN